MRSKMAIEKEELEEVPRQLDSIMLSTDCMDDEIAHALFNYDENEFEEILDDFCMTANEGMEDEQEFDYDAHIAGLLKKTKNECIEIEDDFFTGMIPLQNEQEFYSNAKFEETLAEYDNDQIGDIENEK